MKGKKREESAHRGRSSMGREDEGEEGRRGRVKRSMGWEGVEVGGK